MGDDGSQTSGEVTLVWIEHSQLLTEGIWRSFKEKENVDIKLRCEHYNNNRCDPSAYVNVDAHRLILSILCPNFDINSKVAVFRGGVLNFDLDVDELNIFFELLYRGKVTVAEKQLGVLRQCAEALQAFRVIEIIDEYNFTRMSKSKVEDDSYQTGGRRKRKSKPVKLQKSVVESTKSIEEVEENLKENDQELVNEQAEDKSFDNQEQEACDSDVSDEIEEKVPGKEGKNAKSLKKNSEITRNRTAYKRIWRLNQPLQKCSHCSYETRDKESFRNHVNKHDPSAEKFVCRYCEKTFRSKRGFARHQNIHLQPDRIQRCPLCAYLTPLRSTMVQHMGTVHKADIDGNPLTGKYKCPDCDFNCLFECQLKIHLIRKHKKERPFKCNECEYSAVLKSDLDKHVSIVHRLERPYMCEVCGFRSQSQGGYNRHKRVHTGEKPFQCDLCGKQYADSRKHKIHVRRHENDEKPFTCHLCGHSCRRKDNLKMHLKRIHKTTTEVDPMLMVSGEENDQEDQNIVIESIVSIADENNSVKRLKSSNQVEHDNSSQLMQQQQQESNIAMLNGEMTDTVVIYY